MKPVLALTILFVAGAAQAQILTESESNNTLATANSIGSFGFPGGTVLIDGTITEGDVDWFSFSLDADAGLAVFAVFSGTNNADPAMQVVNADGVVIAFNDDSLGLLPAIQLADLSAGTYFVGVSGFGDQFSDSVGTTNIFDGLGHGEEFAYKLTIGASVVPSPASIAMLGLGGAMMVRRRR